MHFHETREDLLKDLFNILNHHKARVSKQALPVSEPERITELIVIALGALSNNVTDLELKLLELERKVNGNP